MTASDDSPVPDYPGLLRLDGKGAVVVGAGQGIGRQTTHALAQAGARVFCIDNHEPLAKEIADEVGGVPWACDARERSEVEEAVAAARRELGRVHALVDIVGTPEQCLEKVLRYGEAGVDQLLCYMQFGKIPHEKVLRSLELMATEIIPELEKRGHRVDAQAVASA